MDQTIYPLHSLGWKAFQNLCLSITSEVMGQTVQGFFDSNDGGRDGAFYGNWASQEGNLEGNFAIQCKFTAKPSKQLTLKDLEGEVQKATRLAKNGLADNYIIMSSAHLTGTNDEKIRKRFEAIPGIKTCVVFGLEKISQWIRESAALRMLVPRIYGLGDLSTILDERAQAQAREVLSSLGGDLDKFVVTDAHQRSAKALSEHGFVLLLGEPACGKSTIAAALAVAALDRWGCVSFKLRDADDFVRHWNPNEPRQLFWIDDAFGATQVDYGAVAAWNQSLLHVQAAIKKGARVIFTSRDYIYRAAKERLKQSSFPLLNESKVVINVQDLTQEEREQILYNHIRLGAQPKGFRTLLKPHLEVLARKPRFTPEAARRLGNPLFTKNVTPSSTGLDRFIEHPEDLLKEVIQTLDHGSKSALALVFMRAGRLESPVDLNDEEARAVELLGGDKASVRSSLSSLDGTLVLNTVADGRTSWSFKHPTIRDAFAALISEDRELLDIYIAGTPLTTLFNEVTCGDVGIKGVRVMVPEGRFDSVIARILAHKKFEFTLRRSLHWFLSKRCDVSFLKRFLELAPEFTDQLLVYSYLYVVSDLDVILRLNDEGLLPDKTRAYVISRFGELAVSTPDAGFLDARFNGLLSQEDRDSILNSVEGELIPRLPTVILDTHANWDGEETPEITFNELVGALEAYRASFSDKPTVVGLINDALAEISQLVEEMNSSISFEADWNDESSSAPSHGSEDHRSIFDDVDQ